MTLMFKLPYPPSVNSLYAIVRGRKVLSKKGRLYKELVAREIKWTSEPLDGNIMVDITIWPPDKRRRDIDNVAKALLDSLTYSRLYHDDSQIKKLVIEMMSEVKKDGEVLIKVGEKND